MKALCEAAGVERSKVFPHNLRSLFARSFYGSCHDVVRLADVLGHSSIETTRIYLMSTGNGKRVPPAAGQAGAGSMICIIVVL